MPWEYPCGAHAVPHIAAPAEAHKEEAAYRFMTCQRSRCKRCFTRATLKAGQARTRSRDPRLTQQGAQHVFRMRPGGGTGPADDRLGRLAVQANGGSRMQGPPDQRVVHLQDRTPGAEMR